ncbi:hypothetical protein ACFO26_03700 [Lactococcus nasutitermitis]|uniref:Cell surface protein n=2 Tax=Lactococcus nasutitermitis TaxID=1652957 RepID=A0ABV9JC06_9LACT|nr:hypothetical protein [Lactococcus nasutitermitis]
MIAGLLFATALFGVSTSSSISLLQSSDSNYLAFADTANNLQNQQLSFGQTINIGGHLYPAQFYQDNTMWTNVGATVTSSSSAFAINLVTNQPNSAGYSFFREPVDMTQAVHLSGEFSLKSYRETNPLAAGDALGFIFTPASMNEVSTNLVNAVSNQLGIGGLSDSIFAGRDLYNNPGCDSDNIGLPTTVSNNVVIRQTNSTGALINSGYAVAEAADSPDNSNVITDQMGVDWQPQEINSDENTVTGQLNYTITTVNGKTTNISQNVTVPCSMLLGIVGATGNYYGTLSYASQGGSFSASKITKNVQVNYINQQTQQEIGETSTILANVGDQISINDSQSSSSDNSSSYDFIAPSVAGYNVQAVKSVIVSDDNASNVIDVYYNPIPKGTAVFHFAWLNTNTNAELPKTIIESGLQGSLIAKPNFDLLAGYDIAKVVNANGAEFNNLDDALASSPNFSDGQQNFTIYLAALPAKVKFDYQYAAGTHNTSTQLPNIAEVKGLVGDKISLPYLPKLPVGYSVSGVVGPDGKDYPDLKSALLAYPNFSVAPLDFHLLVSALPTQLSLNITNVDGSVITKTDKGLYDDDYSATVLPTETDKEHNIYNAVVTMTYTDFDGKTQVVTSGSDKQLAANIKKNTIAGIYKSEKINISVHYEKVVASHLSKQEKVSVDGAKVKQSAVVTEAQKVPDKVNKAETDKKPVEKSVKEVATDNKSPQVSKEQVGMNKVAGHQSRNLSKTLKQFSERAHTLRVRLAGAGGVVIGTASSLAIVEFIKRMLMFLKK